MDNERARIRECIEHLHAIRFPGQDWKEDKIYYDRMEEDFSREPEDEETRALWLELKHLIEDKREVSLNMNKTTEELYAGWNDD